MAIVAIRSYISAFPAATRISSFFVRPKEDSASELETETTTGLVTKKKWKDPSDAHRRVPRFEVRPREH